MRANTPIQEGYFDATKLLREHHPDYEKSHWQVWHYLDNEEVKSKLITLNKPVIKSKGRYGFTQLPLELYDHYKNWIIVITLKSRLAIKGT